DTQAITGREARIDPIAMDIKRSEKLRGILGKKIGFRLRLPYSLLVAPNLKGWNDADPAAQMSRADQPDLVLLADAKCRASLLRRSGRLLLAVRGGISRFQIARQPQAERE